VIKKTTSKTRKLFASLLFLLYKGSGTSIVLGNPEQGSDRLRATTGSGQVLLPDWQYTQFTNPETVATQ
jgi:hypothetical protein